MESYRIIKSPSILVLAGQTIKAYEIAFSSTRGELFAFPFKPTPANKTRAVGRSHVIGSLKNARSFHEPMASVFFEFPD